MSIQGSALEESVVKFLRTITEEEIILHDRGVLPRGQELDIVILSLNFALEVNGDLFHSDAALDYTYGLSAREYHQEKQRLARLQGFDLYFLWEHHWQTQREFMKDALQAALVGERMRGVKLLEATVGPRNNDFTVDDILDYEEMTDENSLGRNHLMAQIREDLSPQAQHLLQEGLLPLWEKDFYFRLRGGQLTEATGLTLPEVKKAARELLDKKIIHAMEDKEYIFNPRYITNPLRAERLSTETL